MLKPALTPGQERSLKRDETVPPAVARKLQSLPLACTKQLPSVAQNQERVVYAGRVLLIDADYRILDIFDLDDAR